MRGDRSISLAHSNPSPLGHHGAGPPGYESLRGRILLPIYRPHRAPSSYCEASSLLVRVPRLARLAGAGSRHSIRSRTCSFFSTRSAETLRTRQGATLKPISRTMRLWLSMHSRSIRISGQRVLNHSLQRLNGRIEALSCCCETAALIPRSIRVFHLRATHSRWP